MFVVEGEDLDAEALEAQLEQLGDSLLVVGDATRAEDPRPHRRARRGALVGTAVGTIEGVEIANMHRQTGQRSERLSIGAQTSDLETGVVAVVPGAGNRRLFESHGAARIEGGRR